MSDDLVDRLRHRASNELMQQAADEIERLQGQVHEGDEVSEESDLIRWAVDAQTANAKAEALAWRERAERAEAERDALRLMVRDDAAWAQDNEALTKERDALRALLADIRNFTDAAYALPAWLVDNIDAALREGGK